MPPSAFFRQAIGILSRSPSLPHRLLVLRFASSRPSLPHHCARESDMDHDKGPQKISNVASLEKETDSEIGHKSEPALLASSYDSTEEIYLTPGVSFHNNFNIPEDNFNIQMIKFKKSLVQNRLTFLNNASKKELEGLKGIGKRRATYILELREETPESFKSVDDLRELGLSTKEINAMMAQALGDF